jgi:hypothetical protein
VDVIVTENHLADGLRQTTRLDHFLHDLRVFTLERVVEARAALLEGAPDLRDLRKLGAPEVEQPVPLRDAELRPLFSSPSVTAS